MPFRLAHLARPRALRRRRGPVATVALFLATLATLGLVVYLSTSSLPYFASSAGSDLHFGALKSCLLQAVSPPRGPFAVSIDGDAVAMFGAAHLVVCEAIGSEVVRRLHPVAGAGLAAYDFSGALWVARPRIAEAPAALLRLRRGESDFETVYQLRAHGLVGHARGAIVLEADGRLSSISTSGDVLAVRDLPRGVTGTWSFAANRTGTRVSAVGQGGMVVFDAVSLEFLLRTAPCEVTFAWWTQDPDQALLSCADRQTFTVRIPRGEVSAGMRAELPERSVLIPGPGLYVRDCEGLPCLAAGP